MIFFFFQNKKKGITIFYVKMFPLGFSLGIFFFLILRNLYLFLCHCHFPKQVGSTPGLLAPSGALRA